MKITSEKPETCGMATIRPFSTDGNCNMLLNPFRRPLNSSGYNFCGGCPKVIKGAKDAGLTYKMGGTPFEMKLMLRDKEIGLVNHGKFIFRTEENLSDVIPVATKLSALGVEMEPPIVHLKEMSRLTDNLSLAEQRNNFLEGQVADLQKRPPRHSKQINLPLKPSIQKS